MAIPSWAVGVFLVILSGVMGIAIWGLKALGSRVTADIGELKVAMAARSKITDDKIEKVGDKVQGIESRLVRVETRLNGDTNPFGFPIVRTPTPPPVPEE